MNIMALIPARTGSKSIKNKNLIKINKKHLIYFPIQTAKKSKYINKIIVTTDSKKIKKVSERYKAEVPFLRPKKISQQYSLDIEYIKHALKSLKKINYIPDIIVILKPTTPFRDVKIIDEAIKKFIKSKKDSLRSVSIAKETPYKMWRKSKDFISPLMGFKNIKYSNFPRQKLEKIYWQNGYIDIFKPSTVFKYNNELGKKILFFEIKTKIFEVDYKYQIKELQKYSKKFKIIEDHAFPS